MTTTTEAPNLFFIPGVEFPDQAVRAEHGLFDFSGYVDNVTSGPDGGHGWLLTDNYASRFDMINQTWTQEPGESFWRGTVHETQN